LAATRAAMSQGMISRTSVRQSLISSRKFLTDFPSRIATSTEPSGHILKALD
jgi:hypothetical protein